MRVFKAGLVVAVFTVVIGSMSLESGECAPWSRPKPKPKVLRKQVMEQKAIEKKHRYYETHDVNNDGKVNLKDRLLWLRRNRGSYGSVLVSTENKDLYEVMDVNNDGNVDAVEMNLFYDKYDLNGNGLLEDEEIEAAKE